MKEQIKDKVCADEFFHNTEKFIDDTMMIIKTGIDTHIENEILKAIHVVAVDVDEPKIKQWLQRAKLMDEIDKSTLIDIAIKKKILRLEEENNKLKQDKEWLTKCNTKLADMLKCQIEKGE